MAKLTKVGVVRAKLESEAGTAEETAGSESLVEEPKLEREDTTVERAPALLSAGTLKSVPGAETGTFSGKCELRAGSAGSGLDPFCDVILQCCAGKVDGAVYTPESAVASQKTCTVHYWQSGKRKGLYGAHGTCSITGESGGPVYLEFELTGKWLTPEDEATPPASLSATLPMMAKGATLTVHGLSAVVSSFTFDLGVTVAARNDITDDTGVLHYCGTGRAPTLACDPEATSVADHDFDGLLAASTEAAVSLAVTDGTDTVTLAAAKTQYRSVADGDREGIVTHDVVLQINDVDGDDTDWSLTVS